MDIDLYKSHKEIIIFYYLLYYWVVVQISAPIGPPIPIPGVSKRLLPGGTQTKNKNMFDNFL